MHTLFLHANVPDPYAIYGQRLAATPVYWEEENRIWALYSYAACKAVLEHAYAHIPPVDAANTHGLNEYALLIKDNLVRLQNGEAHVVASRITRQLHQCMWPVDTADVVAGLMEAAVLDGVLDWVPAVARQLPVRVLLKSLGFEPADEQMITTQLPVLATIMLPHKTPEQVQGINTVVEQVYRVIAAHLLKKGMAPVDDETVLPLYVSNCVGLFIQSYDAGRGLLCNALLAVLQSDKPVVDADGLRKLIVETLRFNPPVHNTRRVAAADIELGEITIRKGDAVLLVLAAANRDPLQFTAPDLFNPHRANNQQYLSFGAGIHTCIASYFILQLVQDCLAYLFTHYNQVTLLEDALQYERLVNARLVKSLFIKLL